MPPFGFSVARFLVRTAELIRQSEVLRAAQFLRVPEKMFERL